MKIDNVSFSPALAKMAKSEGDVKVVSKPSDNNVQSTSEMKQTIDIEKMVIDAQVNSAKTAAENMKTQRTEEREKPKIKPINNAPNQMLQTLSKHYLSIGSHFENSEDYKLALSAYQRANMIMPSTEAVIKITELKMKAYIE
jgi:hypothetical protein